MIGAGDIVGPHGHFGLFFCIHELLHGDPDGSGDWAVEVDVWWYGQDVGRQDAVPILRELDRARWFWWVSWRDCGEGWWGHVVFGCLDAVLLLAAVQHVEKTEDLGSMVFEPLVLDGS